MLILTYGTRYDAKRLPPPSNPPFHQLKNALSYLALIFSRSFPMQFPYKFNIHFNLVIEKSYSTRPTCLMYKYCCSPKEPIFFFPISCLDSSKTTNAIIWKLYIFINNELRNTLRPKKKFSHSHPTLHFTNWKTLPRI